MAITYDWSFGPATVNNQGDLEKVVTTMMWTLTASEGERTFSKTAGLGLPAPDPKTFIPFEKLTADEVTEWVVENPAVNVPYEEKLLAAQFDLPPPPPPPETLPFPFDKDGVAG